MVDTIKHYSFYFKNKNGRCVEKLFDSADKLLEYIKKYHKTVQDIYHSETGGNYERYVVVAEDKISKRVIPYGTIYTPKGKEVPMIYCFLCGMDIDLKGEDNVSPVSGCPLCESCAAEFTEKDWQWLREFKGGEK